MANGELTFTLNESDYRNLTDALSQLSKIEQDAVIQRGLQESVILFKKAGKIDLKTTLKKSKHNKYMADYMANKRGGSLRNAFTTKIKKKKGKGYAGFNKYGHHAHLVSEGTKDRYTKKGYYRGSVQGSKFWKISFERTKVMAAQELMDSIKISINKIISRNR